MEDDIRSCIPCQEMHNAQPKLLPQLDKIRRTTTKGTRRFFLLAGEKCLIWKNSYLELLELRHVKQNTAIQTISILEEIIYSCAGNIGLQQWTSICKLRIKNMVHECQHYTISLSALAPPEQRGSRTWSSKCEEHAKAVN